MYSTDEALEFIGLDIFFNGCTEVSLLILEKLLNSALNLSMESDLSL